jgi:hypothetical protein
VCDNLDSGIETGLSGFNHARASGAVEETLQRLLLAAVPHNHSDLFDAPASCPPLLRAPGRGSSTNTRKRRSRWKK